MAIPEAWTGPGHIVDEPWIPAPVRDRFAALIGVLEESGVQGLRHTREHFREQGQIPPGLGRRALARAERQAENELYGVQVELLVAAQLVRAEVLRSIRADTPDFECRWGRGSAKSDCECCELGLSGGLGDTPRCGM